MSAQSDIEIVARALVVGDAVDWDAVEASAPDPGAAAMLRELRVISGIADFHRQSADSKPSAP